MAANDTVGLDLLLPSLEKIGCLLPEKQIDLHVVVPMGHTALGRFLPPDPVGPRKEL